MCTLDYLTDSIEVLVVDSHQDSLYLSQALLEDCGIKVSLAASVREALGKLHMVQPDLLISELRLPEEDGYGLMRKLAAFEMYRNVTIPAIALTTQSTQEDCLKALSAGYCCHIAKPFDADELLTAVFQLVEENRQKSNFCRFCG